MRLLLLVAVGVVLTLFCVPTATCAPQLHVTTFQDLMDPSVFPDPQFGMKVESVVQRGGGVTITTTGAVISISPGKGEMTFRQRLDHPRTVAVVKLPTLSGMQVTHRGPGLARVTFEKPRLTIRVNGDSLMLMQAGEPLKVSIDRRIAVAWSSTWRNNHIVADQWGGFALHWSNPELPDAFDPKKETVAAYNLPASSVLCVGVCPPKAYDWERSLRDQIVHTWAPGPKQGYPANNLIQTWRAGGNILLLQGELSQWKDWNRDFTPVNGVAEFERVRNRCEEMGVKMMVYTSPFYYFRGIDGNPQGVYDGRNMEFFLEDITRVMKDYRPHGLYYDGQYAENAAALYALARQSRRIVGENGILEWHSTFALGGYGEWCYMPAADAYIDFIFRGEGTRNYYHSYDYMRFFVSGYNVSNSIGVLCNNVGEQYMPPNQIDDLLITNCRLHSMLNITIGVKPGGSYGGDDAAIAESPTILITPAYVKYWSRLNDTLKDKFLKDIDARQAKLKFAR